MPSHYCLCCLFYFLFSYTPKFLQSLIIPVSVDDAENLQAEYKKQPCHLERLYGILDVY